MDLLLNNKIALVTGASKGLGYATAQSLASEGCQVIIISRNKTNLEKAAATIKAQTGKQVLFYPADVSKKEAIQGLFKFIQTQYGQLDIVVANSGGPKAGKFEDLPEESWYRAIENNLMGTIRLFKAGINLMKKKENGGRLLVITTTGAKQPQDNLIISNTLRAGIHAMVKTLSREVVSLGITVNAVVPGKFMTNRQMEIANTIAKRENITVEAAIAGRVKPIPMQRMGKPSELADYIAYLCSPKAEYITGTALNIDGGFLGTI